MDTIPISHHVEPLCFFSQSLGLRLDDPFYLAFSFMFVFAIGWVIVRVVSLLLHELEYYPLPAKQNHWIGGIIGGLGAYLFVVMVLYLVAMIPVSASRPPWNIRCWQKSWCHIRPFSRGYSTLGGLAS
ncbi:CvpA family protein [Lacticaseibacillus pantheris]|uniref:CvpA family protein n=1 Tax=Lacticaseibacillus pantheris TaxID=171523 RepID=UPI0009E7C00A|nr:CvpA family protein [Lacticaseibacillus pantheris]